MISGQRPVVLNCIGHIQANVSSGSRNDPVTGDMRLTLRRCMDATVFRSAGVLMYSLAISVMPHGPGLCVSIIFMLLLCTTTPLVFNRLCSPSRGLRLLGCV